MSGEHPSSTALGDAFIRAAHVELSGVPLIDDPVSRRLLTDTEWAAFTASVLKSARRQDASAGDISGIVRNWLARQSAAAPHVVLRTRFVRDQVAAAVRSPARVTQYVILAAGLDVFALRRTETARAVSVLEVDLPATQSAKLARIARAGIESAAEHRSADLESGDLNAALAGSGLDRRAPTLVSLAGVSYYLTRGAIVRTLRAVRHVFGPGVAVVGDYWDADHADPVRQDRATASMFASVARNGEPFRTSLTPTRWAELCADAGFVVESDVSAPGYLLGAGVDPAALHARPIGRFTRVRAR